MPCPNYIVDGFDYHQIHTNGWASGSITMMVFVRSFVLLCGLVTRSM